MCGRTRPLREAFDATMGAMSTTDADWTTQVNKMLQAIDEEPAIYLMVRPMLLPQGPIEDFHLVTSSNRAKPCNRSTSFGMHEGIAFMPALGGDVGSAEREAFDLELA